jgi:hypothetical protein
MTPLVWANFPLVLLFLQAWTGRIRRTQDAHPAPR